MKENKKKAFRLRSRRMLGDERFNYLLASRCERDVVRVSDEEGEVRCLYLDEGRSPGRPMGLAFDELSLDEPPRSKNRFQS